MCNKNSSTPNASLRARTPVGVLRNACAASAKAATWGVMGVTRRLPIATASKESRVHTLSASRMRNTTSSAVSTMVWSSLW